MTLMPYEARKRPFEMWLRTGIRPAAADPDNLECKSNPWHDERNGQFTFVGAGRYVGQGGSARGADGRHRSGAPGAAAPGRGSSTTTPAPGAPPRDPAARSAKRSPSDAFTGGGGGRGGGAGATGKAIWPDAQMPRSTPAASATPTARIFRSTTPATSATSATALARPATAIVGERRRVIVANGYNYELEAGDRMRHVWGEVSLTATPVRSRSHQAAAGGADRRKTDDGGHYIAARFNGPTEAFNHFAQDANFNRGRYRAFEEQLATAKKQHKRVTISIVPHYHGASRRPYELDVSFTIDGRGDSVKMPNEPTEKTRGK